MASSSPSPLFSVVIPTRGGMKYVRYAVSSALSTGEESLEVIISDNSTSRECLRDSLGEEITSDTRVSVVRPPRELSMTGNFNFGIAQAKGDWVTVLGSDDALMPHTFSVIRKQITLFGEIDAIVGARSLYFWPGCETVYGDIAVRAIFKASRSFVDSAREARSIGLGLTHYFDSVQIYTGSFVHRRVLQRIRTLSPDGQIFRTCLPDGYSTFAVLAVTRRFLRLGVPIAWTGSSPVSNGLNGHLSMADGVTRSITGDFLKLGGSQDIPYSAFFGGGHKLPLGLATLGAAQEAFAALHGRPFVGDNGVVGSKPAALSALLRSDPRQYSQIRQIVSNWGVSHSYIRTGEILLRWRLKVRVFRYALLRRLQGYFIIKVRRQHEGEMATVEQASKEVARYIRGFSNSSVQRALARMQSKKIL